MTEAGAELRAVAGDVGDAAAPGRGPPPPLRRPRPHVRRGAGPRPRRRAAVPARRDRRLTRRACGTTAKSARERWATCRGGLPAAGRALDERCERTFAVCRACLRRAGRGDGRALPGTARAAAGDPEALVEDCTRQLRDDPKNAAAYLLRGAARLSADTPEGAGDDLAEALRRKPDFAFAYALRGRLHAANGALRRGAGRLGAGAGGAARQRLRPDDARPGLRQDGAARAGPRRLHRGPARQPAERTGLRRPRHRPGRAGPTRRGDRRPHPGHPPRGDAGVGVSHARPGPGPARGLPRRRRPTSPRPALRTDSAFTLHCRALAYEALGHNDEALADLDEAVRSSRTAPRCWRRGRSCTPAATTRPGGWTTSTRP